MSAKAIFILCAQAFLVQTISAACWGNAYDGTWSAGWAGPALGVEAPLIAGAPCAPGAPFGAAPFLGASWAGCGSGAVVPSNGGGFLTSSASPIPPVGVAVESENAIEGILAVGGELPFLGTVGLEGALPTAGVGAVAYGCGNGAVGMVSEDIAPAAAGWPLPAAGFGYGTAMAPGFGWAGRGFGGCGCGALI